ncbi:hypothetical protein GCM10027355_34240 [Haloplanus salinarum]
MQKPDLRPTDGADPNHVTVAETVMNDIGCTPPSTPTPIVRLRIRLVPTRSRALPEIFPPELHGKHVVDAIVFVDQVPWLLATAQGSDSSMNAAGIGMPSNVSFVK